MYFFGGEGLQGFSFCLVVGFLTGIYSTVYIASPILLEWLGKKTPKAAEKPTAVAAASR
jgi:SecD/SecF fusion protein